MPPSSGDAPSSSTAARHVTLADVIDWAIWFGAATALGETAAVAVVRAFTTRLVFITRDIVWRGPISNILLYAALGAVLALAMRRRSRATALGVLAAVFVFCAVVGPLLQLPRLHPYAALLLAAGMGTQALRLTASRAEGVGHLIRVTRTALALTCLVLAVGFIGLREVRVRRTISNLQPRVGAPNVLLIVLDTVRAQSLSLYGYTRQTSPRIDAFARSGVRFDNAIVQAPWTLPSHSSIFTGHQPHELSADWLRPLDGSRPTLAEVLQQRGYVTVGEVANLLYTTSAVGLDRGFLFYSDFPFSTATLMHQSWIVRPLVAEVRRNLQQGDMKVRKTGEEVTDNFLDWVQTHDQRPFFAFLNYFDAHAPYRAPAPYSTMYSGSTPMPDLSRQREWSGPEAQRFQDAYEGAINYVDAQVGRLLDSLRQQGLLDNTIVVITSDHGEQFGEHGLYDHANSLYRPLLHVPLVVSYPPRIPAGRSVRTPVALDELADTILQLVDDGGRGAFGKAGLAGHWTTDAMPARPIYSELSQGINTLPWLPVSKGSMRSVLIDGWHYIHNGDGTEELYDFTGDVAEAHNRVNDTALQPTLDAARKAVASTLGKGNR